MYSPNPQAAEILRQKKNLFPGYDPHLRAGGNESDYLVPYLELCHCGQTFRDLNLETAIHNRDGGVKERDKRVILQVIIITSYISSGLRSVPGGLTHDLGGVPVAVVESEGTDLRTNGIWMGKQSSSIIMIIEILSLMIILSIVALSNPRFIVLLE